VSVAQKGGERRLSPVIAILCLSMAGVIGLGLSRFAYALVLTDMRSSLGWSYSQAGLMNTLNAAGYLMSALLTARAARRFGEFRTALAGVLITATGIALTAASSAFGLIALARLLAGFGGAFAFVAGGVLAAAIAQREPHRSAFLLSLFYIGPGIGVILSGALVPPVLAASGPGSWRLVWLLLAVLAGAGTLIFMMARKAAAPAGGAKLGETVALRPIAALLACYCGFGAGYIGYMTFMIAYLRDTGSGPSQQALFWMVLGLAAIASPWLWSGLLARAKGGFALFVLNGAAMVGAVIPLISTSLPALLISAIVFGCSFLAVVAGITAFVRGNLPRPQWTAAIGWATVAFGIGQTLGPFATGFLTDLTGSLAAALWASAALLALAAMLAALQRDLAQEA
jgi:predicted MFS family arabinose efflux permease